MATYIERDIYTGDEPITRQEAKDYLKVDSTDDDTFIDTLISAVREFVEEETSTALVVRNYIEYRDKWPVKPDVIELQMNAEIIAAVQYLKDGSYVTLALDTDYYQSNFNGLPKLEPKGNWPNDIDDRLNAVKVTYSATPLQGSINPALKQAMYLLLAHWYDNRSAVTYGTAIELPIGYKRIINNYKSYIY